LILQNATWRSSSGFISVLTGGRLGVGSTTSDNDEVLIRNSALVIMLPGDSVASRNVNDYFHLQMTTAGGGGGTNDEAYELSVSVPPQSQAASVPSEAGWLVAGLLIGLGIKVLRGPVRRGLAA
jgi:hypothetical protein